MIEKFIRYSVWNHLLMVSLLVFGLLSLSKLQSSFFPETDPQQLTISVALNGASPTEVEQGVLLPIERAIEGVNGIDQITSVAYENSGRVIIEVENGESVEDVQEEVKAAVDRIPSWPTAAETPKIQAPQFRNSAGVITIYGPAEPEILRHYGDLLKQELMAVPGVSQVSLSGVPAPEISIQVSDSALQAFGLHLADLQKTLQGINVERSAGLVKETDKEVQMRVREQKMQVFEIQNLVVKTDKNGGQIRLRDVAQVTEKIPEGTDILQYKEENAILVKVDKTRSEDILFIVETMKEKMEEYRVKYPYLNWELTKDMTVSLTQRIDLLTKNGLQGFFLVVAVLAIFMNFRLAFWVALGIPISLSGMFILMYFFNITINVISLFGMILVIGIVVDDAIVVGENIFQKREKGLSPFQAAIEGTKEVFWPVFMSVLTTIIAFTPYFFFAGMIGTFIWHCAFVVIATLAVSIIESMYILPGHLAHSKGMIETGKPQGRIRRAIDENFQNFVEKWYQPVLRFIIRRPLTAIALYLFFLIGSIQFVTKGLVGITFFPHIPRDSVTYSISLSPGSKAEETIQVLNQLKEAVKAVGDSLQKTGVTPEGVDLISSITLQQGSSNFRETGSHAGNIEVEFADGEVRKMETFTFSKLVREKVGELEGVEKIDWGTAGRWGKPVSVSLTGKDPKEVSKASLFLQELLRTDEDLNSIIDNNVKGAPELVFVPTDLGRVLGLNTSDILAQVRTAYFGLEVQRLQRSDDEVRVWVRMDSLSREGIDQLGNFRVRDPKGVEHALETLFDFHWQDGVTAIQRLNGAREIRVEAGVKDPEMAVEPILARIQSEYLPELSQKFPTVKPSFEGRQRDRAKFMVSLKTSYGLALIGIYISIALVFKSFVQPLLVMGMIPLSLCGAILGHGIMGQPMSFLSLLGIVALFGIVINDSIVYIDRINQNRAAGIPLREAVIEAGTSRFRPILLTTISTVVGLGPLLFETNRQAKFLIPMAISVSFGLLVGSVLILILIPSQYYMVYRTLEKWEAWKQKKNEEKGVNV